MPLRAAILALLRILPAHAHIEKVTHGKKEKDLIAAERQAYEDIIWALINTKEFLFNH